MRLASIPLAATIAVTAAPAVARPPPEVVGNVVVMPTDEELLTSDEHGGWGVRYDESHSDPERIARAFYAVFPDDFDYLTVFTAFNDASGTSSLAFAIPIRNRVAGIGLAPFDQGKVFGSPARLATFVNMRQSVDLLQDDRSVMWPVWAEEVGHLDLAHLKFSDQGAWSDEMLGRDHSHWSALLQADGSVMDGNQWRDEGDGTFTKIARAIRYSPLDQYVLGLRDADDVPAFFVLRDAFLGSQPLGPLSFIPEQGVVRADRHNIGIDDVMAASGARLPQYGEAPATFRMAVLLLLAPGDASDSGRPAAEKLDALLPVWERKWREYADGRGTLCTRLREDCAPPGIVLSQVELSGGNEDGVVDPGEAIEVVATLTARTDTGPVTLTAAADGLSRAGGPLVLPSLTAGVPVPVSVPVTVGALACGAPLRITLRAETDGQAALGVVTAAVGVGRVRLDDFETDTGWHRVEQTTAGEGAWERGAPEQRVALGLRTQPAAAFDGASVWATGLAGGPEAGFNDVDGTEVLESPPLASEGLLDVTVRYALWWNAVELAAGFPFPSGDPFVVSASWDGGPFVEIDRVGRSRGITNRWTQRIARVPGGGAHLVLRFTATDEYPDSAVEAALDHVELLGRTTACPSPGAAQSPDGGDGGRAAGGENGCNCGLGRSTRSTGATAPMLVGLALVARRRYRQGLARRRRGEDLIGSSFPGPL